MKKNAHGFWDAPLWKDWLAYLTGLAIYVVILLLHREGQSGHTLGGGPQRHVDAIDYLLAIAWAVFVFGVVPGTIRILVRRSVVRHRANDSHG